MNDMASGSPQSEESRNQQLKDKAKKRNKKQELETNEEKQENRVSGAKGSGNCKGE